MKKGKTLLEISGFHFFLNEIAIGYFNIFLQAGISRKPQNLLLIIEFKH